MSRYQCVRRVQVSPSLSRRGLLKAEQPLHTARPPARTTVPVKSGPPRRRGAESNIGSARSSLVPERQFIFDLKPVVD